jgi:hypothetical protein
LPQLAAAALLLEVVTLGMLVLVWVVLAGSFT